MDAYENLANAIIVLAAKDYRHSLKKLIRNPRCKEALSEKDSLERFFHSGWYKELTQVDGEFLIEQLHKEAAQ